MQFFRAYTSIVATVLDGQAVKSVNNETVTIHEKNKLALKKILEFATVQIQRSYFGVF